MKIPICSLCGQKGHYKTYCWRNPARKYAIKRNYSRSKVGKAQKWDKLLSNEKSLDRKALIVELDKYLSLYVRVKESDKNGIGECYCCRKRYPWRMMDLGHYRSRRFISTRWDLVNCHSCCQTCNRVKYGNLTEYRKWLVKEYGEDKVREIETRKDSKIPTVELEEMLVELKQKYKELLEQKKRSE